MDITQHLKLMVDKSASDLFFSTGAPVGIKIEGITRPVGNKILSVGIVKEVAYSIMTDEQQKVFEATLEMNLGLSVNNLGRFRINVFRQRGEVAMVIRYIKSSVPSLEALGLPPTLSRLIMLKRGLVLVVGATGSGKSTSLASMIDYRNDRSTGHILTIEDPLEFLHSHKKSIVNQREVGLDTKSYAEALKNAMREAPDVILIGEVRDRETMEHAIHYAETGHLCLTTLHANNANQALDRIINFFPDSSHHQLLLDLSLNLKGIISQRLVPGQHARLVPAVEVLLNSPYIAQLIQDGNVQEVKTIMEQSTDSGMQTFDQSLFSLYTNGQISREEALKNADSKNNLGLKIRMEEGVSSDGLDTLQIS